MSSLRRALVLVIVLSWLCGYCSLAIAEESLPEELFVSYVDEHKFDEDRSQDVKRFYVNTRFFAVDLGSDSMPGFLPVGIEGGYVFMDHLAIGVGIFGGCSMSLYWSTRHCTTWLATVQGFWQRDLSGPFLLWDIGYANGEIRHSVEPSDRRYPNVYFEYKSFSAPETRLLGGYQWVFVDIFTVSLAGGYQIAWPMDEESDLRSSSSVYSMRTSLGFAW